MRLLLSRHVQPWPSSDGCFIKCDPRTVKCSAKPLNCGVLFSPTNSAVELRYSFQEHITLSSPQQKLMNLHFPDRVSNQNCGCEFIQDSPPCSSWKPQRLNFTNDHDLPKRNGIRNTKLFWSHQNVQNLATMKGLGRQINYLDRVSSNASPTWYCSDEEVSTIVQSHWVMEVGSNHWSHVPLILKRKSFGHLFAWINTTYEPQQQCR